MITATIGFEATLAKKHYEVVLSADIFGDVEERPLSYEATKELLVQIAVAITNPEYLETLARDLSAPAPPEKAPPAAQLSLPAVASGLRRVK
ncbi:MAG TPA: hypothetical protein VHY84_27255 [Bryobacteraceae bacterium]|nr:hypothetical protein [Bryobacteraceae bacterium]